MDQKGRSALEFLFAPWFVKTDYINLRSSLMTEVKKRFDEEGIEIPIPTSHALFRLRLSSFRC